MLSILDEQEKQIQELTDYANFLNGEIIGLSECRDDSTEENGGVKKSL